MHQKKKFVVSETIFAARLAHGPLTRREARYRTFLSCEFWELLDVDPWLATARPTPRGRRILVPLIHQVLGHQGELPASMVDWVRLYRLLVGRLLGYFESWTENNGFEASSGTLGNEASITPLLPKPLSLSSYAFGPKKQSIA